MPKAKTLAHLLRIRDANAPAIDKINGHLGSALGLKTVNTKLTAEPSLILFVPQKVSESLLPASQKIPSRLEGPNGLWCHTDVVVGKKARQEPEAPPLTEANERVVNELQSGRIGVVGGIQLGGFESNGGAYVGTAACVVRRKVDGRTGLLTNQHVGGPAGRPMYHPEPGRYRVGFTRASFEYDPDEEYFDGLIDEEDAYYRIDCAFVELTDQAASLAKPGLHKIGSIGSPFRLNLNSMGPLGRHVVSIGRTRGVQRGTIVAFAYEWYDEEESIYTDYLIIGEKGGSFSDHGDSGKLIVTDDAAHNPIALLWGGWFEKLRNGYGQENWTYAIDINKVLNKLEVEVLTKAKSSPKKTPGTSVRARAAEVSR